MIGLDLLDSPEAIRWKLPAMLADRSCGPCAEVSIAKHPRSRAEGKTPGTKYRGKRRGPVAAYGARRRSIPRSIDERDQPPLSALLETLAARTSNGHFKLFQKLLRHCEEAGRVGGVLPPYRDHADEAIPLSAYRPF